MDARKVRHGLYATHRLNSPTPCRVIFCYKLHTNIHKNVTPLPFSVLPWLEKCNIREINRKLCLFSNVRVLYMSTWKRTYFHREGINMQMVYTLISVLVNVPLNHGKQTYDGLLCTVANSTVASRIFMGTPTRIWVQRVSGWMGWAVGWLPGRTDIYIQTHRVMEGIYEVRCWDGLRCHDIHMKFNKDCLRHSKVDRGDSQTRRYHGDLISLL
jgi:hypothetical protein